MLFIEFKRIFSREKSIFDLEKLLVIENCNYYLLRISCLLILRFSKTRMKLFEDENIFPKIFSDKENIST
jgi:hypothetical protein